MSCLSYEATKRSNLFAVGCDPCWEEDGILVVDLTEHLFHSKLLSHLEEHITLALISPRRVARWARPGQSAGHV